ncbi:hypothetical protein [Rhizobium sp. SG2393]|uniref:hypothetical protein n=1 Tax=Rhizobium sp. SG2393 TaxID=3276279 RepID=UPI00366BA1A5
MIAIASVGAAAPLPFSAPNTRPRPEPSVPTYMDEPMFDPNAPDEALMEEGRAYRAATQAFSAEVAAWPQDEPAVYVDQPLFDTNAPDMAVIEQGRAIRAAAGGEATAAWAGLQATRTDLYGEQTDEALRREQAINAIAARAPAALLAVNGLASGPLLLFADDPSAAATPAATLTLLTAGYSEH